MALGTFGTGCTCEAYWALRAAFALDSLETLRAGKADGTLRTFGTGCACETYRALKTYFTLDALQTLLAGFAWET